MPAQPSLRPFPSADHQSVVRLHQFAFVSWFVWSFLFIFVFLRANPSSRPATVEKQPLGSPDTKLA